LSYFYGGLFCPLFSRDVRTARRSRPSGPRHCKWPTPCRVPPHTLGSSCRHVAGCLPRRCLHVYFHLAAEHHRRGLSRASRGVRGDARGSGWTAAKEPSGSQPEEKATRSAPKTTMSSTSLGRNGSDLLHWSTTRLLKLVLWFLLSTLLGSWRPTSWRCHR
jgi:hypothetical protein